MSSSSTNQNNSSTFRVNYSDDVANVTGSPKTTTRQSSTTGIGHHINPLHNPYPNRQNPPVQQQTGGMPQYGGSADKCARCSKTVYAAEKKTAAGRSFHSSCFNCCTCKRKLDSTALSEHKGEIYCKPCYTKQFGAHGLISGVTMSTETSGTRRPSYGNDIDTPGMTNQPTRQRTSSQENIIRNEYRPNQTETSPKKYPQHHESVPEQNSPSKRNNDGVNALVDSKYQRSPSPSTNDRHRSTYIEEGNRSNYVYEGQKMPYGSGASAVVNIPVVANNRKSDSTINRYEQATESTRDRPRSRSPSITSGDSYRRQSSREQQIDITGDYSRLTMNDDNNSRINRQYSNENTFTSENPTRNFSHSSSYEPTYRNPTTNPNNSDRGSNRSRESSPSNTNRNRSPSPAGGYISSTATTRTTSSTYKTGPSYESPSATHAPQYDYRSTETSSNPNYNRRSASPQAGDRTSTGLIDFVSKTNLAGNLPSSTGTQNSGLSALVTNMRRQHTSNDDDFDD